MSAMMKLMSSVIFRYALAALLLTSFSFGQTQRHEIGETLPHFLASEHVRRDCIVGRTPEKGVCIIMLAAKAKAYYTFRGDNLVEIEVYNWQTSFETAVQDVIGRYGKKPNAQQPYFQIDNVFAYTYAASWELPSSSVVVYKVHNSTCECDGAIIRAISNDELRRQRGDDNHTTF